MAATDKTYRSQRTLDIVFAISCILMLLSIVWMFCQDYYRPYKSQQRTFRDVEVALAQRLALANLPSAARFKELKNAVEAAKKERDKHAAKIQELDQKIGELTPQREKAEAAYQDVKARRDSIRSFYDLAVQRHGKSSALAETYFEEIKVLEEQVNEAQKKRDNIVAEIRTYQKEKQAKLNPLVAAQSQLKKLTDDFEIQVKAAAKKQWTIFDSIRSLPIINGFADPIEIKQFTIKDVPIDYNFAYVTRFDRCMSCHLGIDRATYTKGMLRSLGEETKAQAKQLKDAREILTEHRKALDGLPELKNVPTPDELQHLSMVNLTEAQVNEYCGHPRLDLYVGSNSKHPAVEFGCTSCHRGQGSATDFSLAAHTPDNRHERERWINKTAHGWDESSQHFWDFPMLPRRFVEASCIKCHHEVGDLISVNNRIEAPKLIRGYNLIQQMGCFGCHEIKGRKYNRSIGPDLRLEPTPPLSELTTGERQQLLSDPENMPGTLRKVGPSLYRVAEKTNPEWTVKWLRSPRSFRPDTRMPHFYGLSNNSPEALPKDQKKFPDAEMQAIVYYLFNESKAYLDDIKKHQNDSENEQKKDVDFVNDYTIEPIIARPNLTDAEKKKMQQELDDAKMRIRLRNAAPPIQPLLGNYKGDPFKGRELFVTKGCLACHRHEATTKSEIEKKKVDKNGKTEELTITHHPLDSHAQHGPDLSQIKAKLGTSSGDIQTARLWLMNWIKNPSNHSPRTKMPVVPLTDEEILDITAWLLNQEPKHLGADWDKINVKEPDEKTLKALADVYLVRQLSDADLIRLKKREKISQIVIDTLPADEKKLVANYSLESIRYYVGKKAVARMGCFGCHDIPGFDSAKSIGVGLNDWGKRDPTRLAFEDIIAYVTENYHIVDSMTKEKTVKVDGKKKSVKVPQPFVKDKEHGKTVVHKPYEWFFYHRLAHHDRIGYLNQKLLEPRSYDFNRIRAWDDRARMPQFRFARTLRKPGESDADYEARKWKAEAEARDAVMTFVLGLVAEKVPLKSLARPTGDRLAQVKGRKILQTFNCNGCHTIRPGEYAFSLTKGAKELLELAKNSQQPALETDHTFFDHNAWTGGDRKAGKGTVKAYGVPTLSRLREDEMKAEFLPKIEPDPRQPKKKIVYLRLTEALRYFDQTGKPVDIRAGGSTGYNIFLEVGDMIYPPPDTMSSPEKFAAFEEDHGAFGGTFSYQLTSYLIRRDPEAYKADLDGDSNYARASSPPSLIGEGGRTQPGWLYRFLLNPTPVRKMVELRMPRFNLSKQDAQELVAYFSAVERLTNPRFGITEGEATIPQKAGLDDPFWRKRTADYVQYLKNTKVEGSDQTLYEQRLETFRPLWQQIAGDLEKDLAQAKKQQEVYSTRYKESESAEKKAKEAKDNNKDEKKVTELEKQYQQAKRKKDELEQAKTLWDTRVTDLQSQIKNAAPVKLRRQWEQEQAYVIDSFRVLLDSKNLCSKCHQVGPISPSDPKSSGPPLMLAQQRLRPDWIRHWLARPSRLVTYPSPMINYFEREKSLVGQHILAGVPRDQFQSVANTLMIYNRVLEMPLTRRLILPTITGDKK